MKILISLLDRISDNISKILIAILVIIALILSAYYYKNFRWAINPQFKLDLPSVTGKGTGGSSGGANGNEQPEKSSR